MRDYICRDAAIRAVTAENLDSHMDSVMDGVAKRYHRAAERVLASVHAADVAPVVRGKWVEQHSDFDLCGIVYYECSECKREQQVKWHYCPNCGAKMDGDGDV